MAIINARVDVDALKGTPEHAEFLAFLAGTLYRLERDDEVKEWLCIEDDSTIRRFGFTRTDFPNVKPPALPDWIAPKPDVPQTISRFQARAALLQAGKLDAIETLMADTKTARITKLAWTDALVFERNSPTVLAMAKKAGISDAELDTLFTLAAGITA